MWSSDHFYQPRPSPGAQRRHLPVHRVHLERHDPALHIHLRPAEEPAVLVLPAQPQMPARARRAPGTSPHPTPRGSTGARVPPARSTRRTASPSGAAPRSYFPAPHRSSHEGRCEITIFTWAPSCARRSASSHANSAAGITSDRLLSSTAKCAPPLVEAVVRAGAPRTAGTNAPRAPTTRRDSPAPGTSGIFRYGARIRSTSFHSLSAVASFNPWIVSPTASRNAGLVAADCRSTFSKTPACTSPVRSPSSTK